MEKIQKTDRRTRYTCQTIKDILLEELKTKPYSKITVTEICQKSRNESGYLLSSLITIYDDVLNEILEEFSFRYIKRSGSCTLSLQVKLHLSVL